MKRLLYLTELWTVKNVDLMPVSKDWGGGTERGTAVNGNKGKLQSGKLFIIEVAKFDHPEDAPQHIPLPKNQLLFQEIPLCPTWMKPDLGGGRIAFKD